MKVNRASIEHRYDDPMRCPLTREYYGQSDFFNLGYWLEDTRNQREACENLMERLLAFIPEKEGTTLDVACGLGATTRHLLRYYTASDVIGINLSEAQLEICRANAPGCTFTKMDAVGLGFGDATLDNVVCVEAAFHFDTRKRFLREACRVLKPGGYLVASDMLFRRWVGRANRRLPEANYVRNLEDYRSLCLRAGFQEAKVFDATDMCWNRFCRHLARWSSKRLLSGKLGPRTFGKHMFRILSGIVALQHYILIWARKA